MNNVLERNTVREKTIPVRKRIVIVCIVIPVALLHFVTGESYSGPAPDFVNGYLLDILLPLAFYFLICLVRMELSKSWIIKASLVFLVACSVELAQLLGLPVLGRTYDPLDFFMYGVGVLLATVLDVFLFPRLFPFWTSDLHSKRGK